MKIYYYDLGVYNGGEIDLFLQIAKDLKFDYEIHGFEAYPVYAHKLKEKYKNNNNINIHELLIGDFTGKSKLYVSTAEEGHSKYASKNNCTKTYVNVNATKFSDFVEKGKFEKQFNIVRFNIEGAEWDFINDMIETGLYRHVKIWLGATPGEDILKCGEIKHLYSNYLNLLNYYKINIHRFIYWDVHKNANLKQMINDRLV